jgi:phosphohistidine phosphatase
MRVVLLRHAIAVPRETPGVADDDRPLTPKGRRRFRRGARGLSRLLDRPDVLLTSPRRRARETAELAGRAWGRTTPVLEPALADESPERVLAALARRPGDTTIVLVGHEPQLSRVLASLLGTRASGRLALGKGGAALLELDGPPRAGGRLLWLLSPRLLRRLGRA